jgi:hypothetical protein
MTTAAAGILLQHSHQLNLQINWYIIMRYQTPYVHDCAIQPSSILIDFES